MNKKTTLIGIVLLVLLFAIIGENNNTAYAGGCDGGDWGICVSADREGDVCMFPTFNTQCCWWSGAC